jgi:hypothetical protein
VKRAISGAGRLHALAATTATRMKALPEKTDKWAQVVKSAGLKPG